jgi:hypothetical protein
MIEVGMILRAVIRMRICVVAIANPGTLDISTSMPPPESKAAETECFISR